MVRAFRPQWCDRERAGVVACVLCVSRFVCRSSWAVRCRRGWRQWRGLLSGFCHPRARARRAHGGLLAGRQRRELCEEDLSPLAEEPCTPFDKGPAPARRRAPRRRQATALGCPGLGCLRPAPRQNPAPALARQRLKARGGLLRRPRAARGPGPRARRLRARRCHAWTSRHPRTGRCSRPAPRAEPAAGQCQQRLRWGRGAGCGASGPARRSGR